MPDQTMENDMKDGIVPKRPERRSRVFLNAQLADAGKLMTVTLRDVSPDGVLAEASSPPPVGSLVQLHYDASVFDASVAWEDGDWFGLHFDHPLPAGSLLDQASPALKVSAPRNYRGNLIEDDG